MVADGDKALSETAAQKVELALAVGREAELGAQEDDCLLRLVAEGRGEGKDVGHPAAVEGQAALAEKPPPCPFQGLLVVDQHREMRGDVGKAGHGPARLVEGIIEYSNAPSAQGRAQASGGRADPLGMLAGEG